MWLQDGCKVHMDSYMASNGSCFMVTWIIFKNHLLKVGLTHNWETMTIQTLTTVDLFYFYHVWGQTWIETHWNSIWLRTRSHMTSRTLYLRVHDHTTWCWRCVGMSFGHFWALTLLWSRLLACVWSDPYPWCAWDHWSGKFLDIIGWDPSVCKSNRLHVEILWFSFIKLGYIL
jgi:hypothetical protein